MNLLINTSYQDIQFYLFDKQPENGILFAEISNNNHTIVVYEVYEKVKLYLETENKELTKIYIVNGPGSFTGTRVGVVFAKTLAMLKNIPIVPINYLNILYATNKKAVALDARGKKHFTFDGEQYLLQTETEIENKGFLKNPKIDFANLGSFLEVQKEKDYQEITITYLKDAI